MRSVGIDVGTGSVSLAVVEWKNNRPAVIFRDYELHRGDRSGALRRILGRLEGSCLGEISYGGTNYLAAGLYPEGDAGRGMWQTDGEWGQEERERSQMGKGMEQAEEECGQTGEEMRQEEEKRSQTGKGFDRISALRAGARILYPEAGSLMDMGARYSAFITGLDPGELPQYAMNGECAAGTGSFLEDQMYRLGLPLEEYSHYVRRAKSIPRLAGRCSVFAKTDLIHRQQEGVGAEDILLGLAYAVVRNFKTSVVRKLAVKKPLVLSGGIVYNEGIRRAARDVFGLQDHEIICGEEGAVLSAVGLAVLGWEHKNRFDWDCLRNVEAARGEAEAAGENLAGAGEAEAGRAGARRNGCAGEAEDSWVGAGKNGCVEEEEDSRAGAGKSGFAGVAEDGPAGRGRSAPARGEAEAGAGRNDCAGEAEGSRTGDRKNGFAREAEAARGLQGKSGVLPVKEYDKNSLHAVREKKEGERTWLGVDAGSTSVNLVWMGEDGAVLDYQYLRTKGDPLGVVSRGLECFKERYGEDFAPERIGVTGSGRYLIAGKFDNSITVDEITAQARAAAHFYPEAETVFEIGGQDSKYICLKDGRVVDFEMNKVCAAGTGSFIEEQAGRLGIAVDHIGDYAMRAEKPANLGERCTVLMESRIAAELAGGISLENICAGLCRSIVNNYLHRVVGNKKVGDIVCLQGGIVHNEGIVGAFYERLGERLRVMPYYDVTGAYGAAWEAVMTDTFCRGDSETNRKNYVQNRRWFLAGYDGVLVAGRATIGIPQSLMLYKFFPMAYQYFKTLGFNVLLTKETDEEIIGLSQEVMTEETCYPVKLLYGHMEALARQGVDYLFVPRVRTMKHATSHVKHNYGCVYMQTAPVLAAKTLNLEKRGIRLLSPLLDLDMGKPQMAAEMIRVGVALGKDKLSCSGALAKGAAAMVRCEKNSEKLGKEIMASLRPEDKVLVLITRNYGIADPVLNMGIPGELLKRGCKVLTLAHLEGHSLDLSEEYPNLYWPFSQHILAGAKIVRDSPNLYAVYLTNHGCGPDTMISHLFREIMGDKPYLSVEVDEHQSAVGVVTRMEAFLSSLRHVDNVPAREGRGESCPILLEEPQNMPVFLPPLSVYADFYARYLKSRGMEVKVLPDYGREDLARGKAVSISKEVCTFSAAVGQVLGQARKRRGMAPCCFLIPQSEGAETEGMVPRILAALLRREGLRESATLYAPFLENFLEGEDSAQFWQCILLGDAFRCMKPEWQQRLKDRGFPEISFPLTWERTKGILLDWKQYEEQGEKIRIFGSPVLLCSSYLNRGLFRAVREHGFRPISMMLSEYLWFWLKEAGREIPMEYSLWMREFGDIYPDAPCGRDPEAAFLAAEKDYPKVTGGNIRYLCCQLGAGASGERGRILVTPAYANYGSVIELIMENGKVPVFHYQPDGNEELEEIEKREIFLNYCG